MQKKAKKLTLHRETLRTLDEGRLGEVLGQAGTSGDIGCYTRFTWCGVCKDTGEEEN